MDEEGRQEIGIDYYTPTFLRYHERLNDVGFEVETVHPIRTHYWGTIPPGEYSHNLATILLDGYIARVEQELASALSQHSILFWLHQYRRLFPGSSGISREGATRMMQRAAFEAAVQKYALPDRCSGLVSSNSVPIERVLDGSEHPSEREYLEKLLANPQLVLVDYGWQDLLKLYELEKLAYEIWRAGAQRRGVGKGAVLVRTTDRILVGEARDDKLEALITSYDRRTHGFSTSYDESVPERQIHEVRDAQTAVDDRALFVCER